MLKFYRIRNKPLKLLIAYRPMGVSKWSVYKAAKEIYKYSKYRYTNVQLAWKVWQLARDKY